MIFTSINFLGFFIVLIGLLNVIRGDQGRLHLLIVASYIFYGIWNFYYLMLIFLSTVSGWGFGILIQNSKTLKQRRIFLYLSIGTSLLMLGYFKYANFFSSNIAAVFNTQWSNADILLPVGISFFTFQTMSYVIDLYRRRIEPCESFPKFMLYIAFFPQLVAGPIVRASEFLPQLERHIQLTRANFLIGGQIFIGGAIQKVLFADNLSIFVDPVFLEPNLYSSGTLWLALLGYSIQILCDFSGYSLMAIGIARILGFTLPENFRMPYISQSITEFWRRWHISLSFWLRDYLYISLGGNHKGELHTAINLAITMLLGGLWHGASWNFVLWGALHGVGLIVHKYWSRIDIPSRQYLIYKLFAWAFTFLYVMLLWVPFRSGDFLSTVTYYHRLFSLSTGISWMHTATLLILIAASIWHVLFIRKNNWLTQFPSEKLFTASPLYSILAALMLITLFAPLKTSPFIYFQF